MLINRIYLNTLFVLEFSHEGLIWKQFNDARGRHSDLHARIRIFRVIESLRLWLKKVECKPRFIILCLKIKHTEKELKSEVPIETLIKGETSWWEI